MLAGLSLQACSYLAMAQSATIFQLSRIRNGYQWLVRIGVAVKTLQDRFGSSMWCIVAT